MASVTTRHWSGYLGYHTQPLDSPRFTAVGFHPPQKFERLTFPKGWNYGVKSYGVEVPFSNMTFLLNLIKICQLFQKLLVNSDGQTETGDIKSLFLFRFNIK
jgi:hypothetical protein